MGLNNADPKREDIRQGVEPHGDAVPTDTAARFPIEELFGLQYILRIFLVSALPVLMFFTVYYILASRFLEALLLCSMGILLPFSYFAMRKSRHKSWSPEKQHAIYQNCIRGFLLIFLIYISYVVGLKGEINRIQWSYIFPIVACICLGKREGFYWAVLFFASMVLILFYPRPEAPSPAPLLGFKLRYLLSFFVLSGFGIAWRYGIEAIYGRLVHRQGELAKSEEKCREAYERLQREFLDRRKAQEALQESSKRIRMIVDNARDVIWMLDTNLRFTFVSSSIEQMLGYTVEEFLSTSQHEILVPDSLELLLKIFAEELAIRNDLNNSLYRSRTVETEQIQKNGARIWVEIKMNSIQDANGSPIGIIGFSRDITDRKREEEDRRALLERLHRAERMEALGFLAGGVAHDLNNVLGVLFVYTELLLEKIPKVSPLRNYVDNILVSGQKGATIIQDLLTLARRGVMVHEVVNLNGVVSSFFKTPVFEKLEADHPRVAFRKELSAELLNIKGSEVHLEKAVMNLLSNAAEAISGIGEVIIRTENRYLDRPVHGYDDVKAGEYVALTVSDTGEGISTDDRGKIFEPFYTKKVMGRSGTGLGLAIVWGTVKDHGGYIDIQSVADEGTVFTLYFPVTRKELAEKKEKIPVELYMGRGESILVVDDTAEQRDIATRMLQRLGYRVHGVPGGEEAVAYLKTQKADLLLLDMIMAPGIDGLETYKRVLEVNPKQKAIIVSGFSETEQVREAQDLGVGAYVRKPYLMEKIGVAVRDELRKM